MKFEHFQTLSDQGHEIPELDIGDPPEELDHCFQWFLELHKERQSGFSALPLTSPFIVTWLHLYGITPFDIELKAVRIIDDAYLEVSHGRYSKTSDNS